MSTSLILGLDPAKRNFTACLMNAQGHVLMPGTDFTMDQEGLTRILDQLRPHRAAASMMFVGIEATASLDDNLLAFFESKPALKDGPLQRLRLDAGQVARFSGARPIRGKTDKADAHRIAQFTRTYAANLDSFQNDPQASAMARLVNEREQLVQDNTAFKNRLQDRLVVSFPEFERVFENPCSELALELLKKVPTAAVCARKRSCSLEKIRTRKGGHAVGELRARELVERARTSIASATEDHDAQAIVHLCASLQFNLERIARIEAQLKAYAQTQGDSSKDPVEPGQAQASVCIPEQIRILDSFPGIALTGASTLVLRSRGLRRFTSGKAWSAQLGACPDRLQTGSSEGRGHLTYRGDRRTRSTLYMLTQGACQFDPAMAFHKWRHQQKGHTPKQAICACMNRYTKMIWTAVRDQAPYDSQRALANAKLHHPQLWKTFVHEVLPSLKNISRRQKIAAQTA